VLNRLSKTGRRLRSLENIFIGAEVLEDSLRRRTKEALGVDIAENYGSTEAFLAWECPTGNRHINAEHCALGDRRRAWPSGRAGTDRQGSGDFAGKSFGTLVRYEIGDYAVAAAGKCDCGRTLPMIGKIIGRAMNLFRLRDGQLISPWHLATAVRNCTAVKQFQIVQNSVGRFYVPLRLGRRIDGRF